MFVTNLQLVDFRSYENVDIELPPGVSVFVGSNGKGKTNLLEALVFLARLDSHRVGTETPLIRFGADKAVIRARIRAGVNDSRQLLAELELLPGKANKASLNRTPLRRARDILGSLLIVLFAPEDLHIVKGDPAQRRNFIDDLSSMRLPRIRAIRSDYEKVLRQRSALLKSLISPQRMSGEAAATLEVWNESLARLGSELAAARLATLSDLLPFLQNAYSQIAQGGVMVNAEYKSHLENPPAEAQALALAYLAQIEQRLPAEIARGVSLVGPHRDDLEFSIGDLPVRGYASHGESWSFACALRIAAFNLLRQDGLEPVLLLDDVFAELDETRREHLVSCALQAEQVLITAAVKHDVPTSLTGKFFRVDNQSIWPDSE
ncbi:MAG: DNA replication/repair protein RecF [Propionibacteriaceae bacterium]|nr:DNA replication/repair protein RecF [Propionibacteriaceae bacterium]